MKFVVCYLGEEGLRRKTTDKITITHDFLHNVSLDNHLNEIRMAFNNLGVSFTEPSESYCIQVANSRVIFTKKEPLAKQLGEIPENSQLIFQISPKLRSIRTLENLKSNSNVKEVVFNLKTQLSVRFLNTNYLSIIYKYLNNNKINRLISLI